MMHMRKGYTYRLKTNRNAEAKFVRFAESCRLVWNKILSIHDHRSYEGKIPLRERVGPIGMASAGRGMAGPRERQVLWH